MKESYWSLFSMDGKRDSASVAVSDGSSAKNGHYYAYKINKFALRENVNSLIFVFL